MDDSYSRRKDDGSPPLRPCRRGRPTLRTGKKKNKEGTLYTITTLAMPKNGIRQLQIKTEAFSCYFYLYIQFEDCRYSSVKFKYVVSCQRVKGFCDHDDEL